MEFRQKHGDSRDLWLKALPVKQVVQVLVESLTTSATQVHSPTHSLPDLQIILVGKFILSTVMELLEFNQRCQNENCEDLMETSECQRYLELFDKIFHRIVDTKDSISKQEMMDMVWQYYDKGTIDFASTSIPELLMQSLSTNVLQENLIDALSNEEDDEKLKHLVSSCSLSSPTNVIIIMDNLFTIFVKSGHHSRIMNFARLFVSAIKKQYPFKYYNLVPTYIVPLLLIYDFLYDSIDSTSTESRTASQKCECFILNIVDGLFNPSNINKYSSYNQVDQNVLSFYIATFCPQLLKVIQRALQNGLCFPLYPYLWTFIKFGCPTVIHLK